MQKFRFRIFLFILVAATVYAACRKTDQSLHQSNAVNHKDRFFSRHASADPQIQVLVQYVKTENEKYGFVEKIIRQIGYPHWDKTINVGGSTSTKGTGRTAGDSIDLSYIPFVRDSQNFVNAMLVVRTTPTDTTHSFICDWQYQQRKHGLPATDTTAEYLASFFMLLDNRVLGHTRFRLNDTLLFSGHPKENDTTQRTIEISNVGATAGRTNLETTILFSFIVCGSPVWCNNHGGCDYTNCISDPDVCYEITGWINSENNPPSGGGSGGPVGGPTGGTGSGSGGGWTPPNNPNNCGGATSRSNDVTNPCVPGWEPFPPPNGGSYNPNAGSAVFNNSFVNGRDLIKINYWRANNVDTIGLDSCRRRLLNKLINAIGGSPIGNMLAKLDKALGIPNTVDKFNIRFLTKPLVNKNATTMDAIYNGNSSTFSATILLDSATSKNATDIFIATILFHEVIHAYMLFIWKKLNPGTTPQQLQGLLHGQVFNAYVDSLRIRDSLNPNAGQSGMPSLQHNYMADHLLQFIANTIKLFDNNPTTPDRYYWYLAWAGLTWKQVRVWNYHWPNCPLWPPANPAPSDDSTRGLKYALTEVRIDTIFSWVLDNEEKSLPGAKGRKPTAGGCY